jgi:hypothetical protein
VLDLPNYDRRVDFEARRKGKNILLGYEWALPSDERF